MQRGKNPEKGVFSERPQNEIVKNLQNEILSEQNPNTNHNSEPNRNSDLSHENTR